MRSTFYDSEETWAKVRSGVLRDREGGADRILEKAVATAPDSVIVSVRAGDIRQALADARKR